MTPEEQEKAHQAEARVNAELARLAAAIDADDHATVEAFTRTWGPLDLPSEPEAEPPEDEFVPPRSTKQKIARSVAERMIGAEWAFEVLETAGGEATITIVYKRPPTG
jgi:hypothetical protein